jgi:glycerol kinase
VTFFCDLEELRANWAADRTWKPLLDEAQREHLYREWRKAVTRSFDWTDA